MTHLTGVDGTEYLWRGEKFEDSTLEFSHPYEPHRVGFTEKLYLSSVKKADLLKEQRIILLQHSGEYYDASWSISVF